MTEKEFYAKALRALDRLNPKMLSSGGVTNRTRDVGTTCCAIGAFAVAEVRKNKVPRGSLRRAAAVWDRMPLHTGASDLITENEHFNNGENDADTQACRYVHVRAWLADKVANAR